MFLDKIIIKNPSIKRHFAKTVTWRIVGTIDTMIVAWFITGNPMTGLKVGGMEVLTKMILYFAHERVWYRIKFGLPNRELETEEKIKGNSK